MHKLIHIKDILFLLSIPKHDQEISPCSCSGLSLPVRGHVLVSNRTKNHIPVLDFPGSFMEFPGSLHLLLHTTILQCDLSHCTTVQFQDSHPNSAKKCQKVT